MKSLIKILIVLTALFLVMTACEWDGPTAMYKQPFEKTASPMITTIDPPEAGAGVNYITIHGENFSMVLDSNKVYIDGFKAEIVESSGTVLKVRRPNRTGDSTTVKVVNYEVIPVAVFTPYKITSVYSAFGGFIDGSELSTAAVDDGGNVYVIQRNPRNVFKITQAGEKTTIGLSSRTVTDAKFGPDGKLILFMNNKAVMQMDVLSGEETEWANLSKRVSFGDFDANGNLYTGGSKSDLIVVKSDLTETAAGKYSRDDILCIRVYDGQVYLLVATDRPDENTPALAIWRHAILNASGGLGERQLVLDWVTLGAHEESVPKCFTFSQDGLIYVGSDNADPVFIFDPTTGSSDILYKGIITGTASCIVWGTQPVLYMIKGGDNWDFMAIEMGKPGAIYY